MKATVLVRSALVLAMCTALPALAQLPEEGVAGPEAIQARAYEMMHEVDLTGGFLPLDPFTKGLYVGGSYTAHFSDFVAWEVARGGYSFSLNTQLRDQLERDFGYLPTAFDSPQIYAGTALLLKPLYGKLSVANTWLVHAELFFSIGGSFFKFSAATDFRIGPTLGVHARIYLNQVLSVRIGLDDHVVLSLRDAKPSNIMTMSLSLGINIGASE